MLVKKIFITVIFCASVFVTIGRISGFESDTAILRGTVYDGQGRTLAGVELMVTYADGSVARVVSSSLGDYEFNKLSRGFYVIEARLRGFREQRRFVFLKKGESHVMDICLQVGVMIDYLKSPIITCEVESLDGRKIKEATVSILNPYDQQIESTGYTNSKGQLNLQTNRGGHHVVFAYKDGYEVNSIFLDVTWDKRYKEKIVLTPSKY